MMRPRLSPWIVASATLLAACAERPASGTPGHQGAGRPHAFAPIDPLRSLLITDLAVVNDPARTVKPCDGASALPVWSFGYLMQEMAAQRHVTTEEFIRRWLGLFAAAQTVNGQVVGGRSNVEALLIGPWRDTGWDLTKVPFQLLAIVNRVDLRRSPLLAGENGGEVRFVFGAVDLSHRCRPLKFTVIVEYGVRKASCGELQDWAREWASLSGLDPSGPRYRKKLDKLTRPIVRSDPKIAKASGSWLDHLRTNEVDLGTDDFWEMRDFRLDPRSGFLRQDPVSMTPMDALNNTPELGLFLNSITGGIHRRDYWVPLRFASGAPLLGAVSRLPKAGVFWAAPGYSDVEARQYFSLNACSGCHSRETGTAFTHIDPSTRALSGFLTGTTVSDPTDPTIPRPFNELARRTQALDVLIQQGCLAVEPLDSLRLVH